MFAFLQALGRLIGTVIGGLLQGIFALVGDCHNALETRFGPRVWAYYLVVGIILATYLTGGLARLMNELLLVAQQLLVMAIIIAAIVWMLRGIFGGGGGGHRHR